MKTAWLLVLANAIVGALGTELLEAAAKTCTCAADCPTLTCYVNDCVTGKCSYTRKPTGSKCPGQSCTNGGVCDDDANDFCNDKAECVSAYKPSSTVCRPASGACDVQETCTGSSGSCPIDSYAPTTMTCSGTANGGPCDGKDMCDGYGNCVDKYLPSTTVCRASKGDCDVAETCSGTASACPIDIFAAPTTTCKGTSTGGACDGIDKCDGKGKCVDMYLPATTVCRNSKGQCDVAESCTGISGSCPADSYASTSTKCSGSSAGGACDAQDYCDGKGSCVDKYLSSYTVCRAAKGTCDVAETCTGSSGSCPADSFAPTSMTCSGTSTGGACDGVDKCDGKGNCIDVYLSSYTVCRAAKGTCDIAESCSGTSGSCPANAFASTSTTCTGSSTGNACDGVDKCDGKGNCVDVYMPSSTVCRASKGTCDVAETCTGTSATCPADAFAPTTTKCSGTSTGGACDGQDYCDGKGACVDAYLNSYTVCRAPKGQCDVAETCTGRSGSCPTDSFASPSTTCTGTSSGNACDGVDKCDGKGNCVDVYMPSTTVCRASKGQCDVAETCTGSSAQCPGDVFAPTSMKCSGASTGGACDGQDYCDGKGNCVDAYLNSYTVCRASKGQCDVAESCSGSSGKCPADVYAPSSTTCTGSSKGNACDGVDKCDGKGNCIDVYLPSGSICRASKGQCDVAETCTGTGAQCPVDTYAPSSTKCTGTCNGNPCDAQDYCDGKGACVDKYQPSGYVCGNTKAGPCTIAATCDGSMGFCPPDSFADSTVSCSGKSSGGVCDGTDKCDGNGACVDKFLNGVVCKKPEGYARPTYCNGKSGSCPVATFLEATHLREMVEQSEVAASEQLLVVRSASPLVLVGLVCAVAAAVAFVATRSPRSVAFEDSYTQLSM